MLMSGRRRHERFQPGRPWDGHVCVRRDVIVQLQADGHLVAIGSAPSVVGERLRLDVASGEQALAIDVEVVDSRPVILAGGLRHRVELEVLDGGR